MVNIPQALFAFGLPVGSGEALAALVWMQ